MNAKTFLSIGAAGIFVAVTGSNASGQDEALPVVKPKVKTVAAFKNGLAFVLKAGETPLKGGWTRMDQLPPAALGSLWIGTTSKTGPVTDVIAYKEKVSESADAISMSEMLEANVGRRVILTFLAGTIPKTVEGTLLSVPVERKPDENALSDPGPLPYPSYGRPGVEPLRAEIVVMQTTNTTTGNPVCLTIPKNLIQTMELLDKPNLNTKVVKELARAKIHVGGDPSRAEITLACLEKGIVWSPSYRINLADEKRAQIELEAVLANDIEDLDNADVSFVVGYPNFSFADVLSPISLQQSVATFVQALMSGGRAQAGRFANVMSQSIAFNNGGDYESYPNPGTAYSATRSMPGEHGEDLYFYRKDGVTMKKGDRASFTILKTSAPYEHIYQWEIADSMNLDDRGYQLNSSAKTEDQVWHVLRLENQSKQPWTTAPAFALNGSLPVAQDTLNYTPPGGRSFLKLTVATDVRAEQTQTETARKQVNINSRNYDEVTVTGKLRLTNWKDKEIAMLVRKSLVGDVLESPEGKTAKVARNLTSVNSNSEIEWEFKLPAGKDRELTYQYKVLLAR
jgi:hypothetical protein